MASNSPARGKHRRPRRSAAGSRGTVASFAVLTAAGSLSGAAPPSSPSSHTVPSRAASPSHAVTETGLTQAQRYQHTLVTTFSTQVTAQQKRAEAIARTKAEALAREKAAAAAKVKAAEAARERAAAEARAKAAAAAKSSDQVTEQANAPAGSYPNDLDGWIHHALAIMQQHGIPGTYNGIYRNIMRESSGNPNVVNRTDSNAAAGTPSEGLLQVIQPTFNTYHVDGTSWSLTDPVANIVAACNYAYHQYGSIDNVNSAY
jgi:SLT domain-containing protein